MKRTSFEGNSLDYFFRTNILCRTGVASSAEKSLSFFQIPKSRCQDFLNQLPFNALWE
jgi:hypothetical protein